MADNVSATHKDWRALALPVILTAVLTGGVKAGEATWGAVSQINQLAARETTQEAANIQRDRDLQAFQQRLDKDFVPRVEVESNRANSQRERQILADRIDRLETLVFEMKVKR